MAFSLARREKSVYEPIRFAFTAREWPKSSSEGVNESPGRRDNGRMSQAPSAAGSEQGQPSLFGEGELPAGQ
ncbi:hypothetical protein, partial [Azohydromonas caseinilytica]|uniref:hypothetical protein n=1 Tax=Azohydromonas caseinilytica TaxID=2728836 RepID=UPI00197BE091